MAVPAEKPDKYEQQGKSPDGLVMGTNSSSIVSKRSVERLYYPNEPHFFRFFVNKFQRRAPLINRGYHLRLKVIDTAVRQFLEEESPRKKVVVNLGCGSDVLPWQCDARYPHLSRNALFVDVDFPDLMRKKLQIVLATPELHGMLGSFDLVSDGSPVLLKSERYCQVGCDIRELFLLKETLSKLLVCPTGEADFLFVAEVSITYLETDAADEVIQWASTLGNSKFCLLEQILPDGPNHPFAQTMLKHFEKLNTPLRSVFRYPDLQSQRCRFQTRGWTDVQTWTLWEAWASDAFMTSEERRSLDAIEPFDEWEELALFASHYIVVLASTEVQGARPKQPLSLGLPQLPVCPSSWAFTEPPPSRAQRRFGVAMVVPNAEGDSFISHVMGHGPRSRLTSCDIFSIGGRPAPTGSQLGGPSARVCHTLTDLGPLGVLLVAGRRSPSSALRDCWLYRKVINKWERVQDLPVPLFRHTAIRLGSSCMALVVGGKMDHQTTSSEFYVYHPERGWLTCKVQGSPLALFGATITEIFEPSSTLHKGLLAGGMVSDGTINQQTLHWQLDLDNFEPILAITPCESRIPEDRAAENLISRFGASCIRDGNLHYLFGGVVAGYQLPQIFDIAVLKAHNNGFELVSRIGECDSSNSSLPFLIGSSVVSLGNGNFSIVGGGGTCFSMGTYWSKGTYTLKLDPQWGEGFLQPVYASPLNYLATTEIVNSGSPPAGERVKTSPGIRSPAVKTILRVKISSQEDFRRILEQGVPVIVEGANFGPCVERWTPEYLVQKVGADREVSVHESTTDEMDFNSKNFRYVNQSFEKFVGDAQAHHKVYLRALSAENPSGKAADLTTDFPTLARDFELPPELETVSENLFSSVLRISGPVNMWLHYDVMANIYVQVRGSKRLILFHPRDVTRLGFAAGASSSSLEVFSALEEGSLDHVIAHDAVVNPGDMLFLPPLWLHTAKPRAGLSIAVNVFFRSFESSSYSAGRDVYGNRDLAVYEKGRLDVKKIAGSFGRVPRDVAESYIHRLAEELKQSALAN